MDRILQDAGGQITLAIYDQNGALVAADPITVRVEDGAGVVVVPTTAASPSDVVGIYGLTLTPAQTAILDTYMAIWTATVAGASRTYRTRFEVVGGLYFTVAEARVFDNAALASVTTYPVETIVAGRELVEAELEVACGVAFVPRSARARVAGRGRRELVFPNRYPRSLVSVSVDGTALSQAELDAIVLRDEGVAWRPTPWPESSANPYNVQAHYAHGYDEPPPRMKRAALVLLRHRLVASNIEDRAISYTDELGTRALAVAGRRGQPFGIPDVDAAVADYDERIPGIA
jgi:hypothetical protein